MDVFHCQQNTFNKFTQERASSIEADGDWTPVFAHKWHIRVCYLFTGHVNYILSRKTKTWTEHRCMFFSSQPLQNSTSLFWAQKQTKCDDINGHELRTLHFYSKDYGSSVQILVNIADLPRHQSVGSQKKTVHADFKTFFGLSVWLFYYLEIGTCVWRS